MELLIRTTTGNYLTLSAEQRRANAERIRSIHGRPLAQRSFRAFDIFPDRDPTSTTTTANTPPRPPQATVRRPAYHALERFIKRNAPTAIIQPALDNPHANYFLAVDQDDQGPNWAIADHDEPGNALFIWRRDSSATTLEEALGTTKRNALAQGCARVIHPANMHAQSDQEADNWYDDKILEPLTN